MSWSDDDSLSEPELETLDISNDQYYQARRSSKKPQDHPRDPQLPVYGSKTIKHSLAAYDLWRPFYPTYLSDDKLRNFHRPKLRHFNTGPMALSRRRKHGSYFPIKSLSHNIFKFQKKIRYKVARAINRGMSREQIVSQILSIQKASQLSVKNGELVLFEYCEENPPVLNQIGMCVNIKTYHRKQDDDKPSSKGRCDQSQTANPAPTNDISHEVRTANQQPIFKYGYEETIADDLAKRLYFATLKPGTTSHMIECNLFRGPIYEQLLNDRDFLIVRTRNNIYIRTVQAIFTVGQIMPLAPIPPPNDSSITKFRSSFSNFYIHKALMEEKSDSRTLDFEKLLKLFPDYSRSGLYKRLRNKGGTYERSTSGGKFVFCGSFNTNVPTQLKQLRSSFTPELYCLNMATLAARQRLRDLNYTESMILPPTTAEIETEVLAAPWNTSKAVLDTIAEKSYLDLRNHLIDPTGPQREGYSCVNWVKSPTEEQQKEALSKEVVRSKNDPVMMKNPLVAQIRKEKLERLSIFNREAQLITDVQNKVLASREDLSSDEELEDEAAISDEENLLDKSFDEQLRDLDRLVVQGRSQNELNLEKEEEERQQMLQEFSQNGTFGKDIIPAKTSSQDSRDCDNDNVMQVSKFKGKLLRITRTYNTPDGRIQRTEVVREPKIIALYVKQKANLGIQESPENHLESPLEIESNGFRKHIVLNSTPKNRAYRRSTATLGPLELSRVEGLTLTISKKVLDPKTLRGLETCA